MAELFRVTVVTPDAQVMDVKASSLVFPMHDGMVGIAANHAPLVCQLGSGLLSARTAEGVKSLFVSGGLARVQDNVVTVLTQQAIATADLRREAAEKELAAASAMPAQTDEQYLLKMRAIDAARSKRQHATA